MTGWQGRAGQLRGGAGRAGRGGVGLARARRGGTPFIVQEAMAGHAAPRAGFPLPRTPCTSLSTGCQRSLVPPLLFSTYFLSLATVQGVLSDTSSFGCLTPKVIGLVKEGLTGSDPDAANLLYCCLDQALKVLLKDDYTVRGACCSPMRV